MENTIDNLKELLNKIRSVGFFERLFGWHKIKSLAIDAIADFERLVTNGFHADQQLAEVRVHNSSLSKDLELERAVKERLSAQVELLGSNLAQEREENSGLRSSLSSKETQIESNIQQIARLEGDVKLMKQENERLATENSTVSEEIAGLRQAISDQIERRNELEVSLEGANRDLISLREERNTLKDKVTTLVTEEDARKTAHDTAVANLREIKDQIQRDRSSEVEARNQTEVDRLRKLKETWSLHQENVKSVIKLLCNRLAVEYVPQVPFKGSPDNTLKICDEYIIFDAKSPAGDDLGNFSAYIRAQAESAKKYAKLENVKSTVYFVVPTNTLETLRQYVFDLADYQVHIISFDSLEQVILSLKKIEEYEFVEFLSPEERDTVCRIVGKYVHMTKRRIQIDHYFLQNAIDLVFKAHNDLPPDFLAEVIKYEKAEKMNPPTEKRAKVIDLAELDEKARRLSSDTVARGLSLPTDEIPENILTTGAPMDGDGDGKQENLFMASA